MNQNYYGFPVTETFGMALYSGYLPPIHDFSETHPKYGAMYNANVMTNDDCRLVPQNTLDDNVWTVDWFLVEQGKYDLRKGFIKCNTDTGDWESLVGHWSYCDTQSDFNYSEFVGNTACYTTDALKYVQSAFFVAVVLFQWSNIFACKSRKSSFTTSPYNSQMLKGILFETVLGLFLVLVPGVNSVFGGRPLDFWQFCIPAVPFSILVLAWDEARKYLVRTNKWFLKFCYW